MKRVALVTRGDRADAGQVVRDLTRWLRARGCQVVMDEETAALASHDLGAVETVARRKLAERADLIVVLGGDGMLLSVARLVGGSGVPILGVNLGHLGFLTATTLGAMYPTLEEVLQGDDATETRMMLTVAVTRDGVVVDEHLALNDLVVSKGPQQGRMIDLEVSADGQLMTAYRADGLIIATPTGSTAYNLSAGGPILFPTMDAFVLTPICSHTLTNRPIVLPPTAAIEVRLLADVPEVALWIDGQPGGTIAHKDVIRVGRAQARIRLVRDPQKTCFEVLRAKLKWGGR